MTVLVTSIPTVIDALLKQWRALAMTDTNGAPVQIFDGYPGPNIPDTFVQIGGFGPVTAEGTQDWQSLGVAQGTTTGPPTRDEHYDIECLVSSYAGGTDAAAVTNAQQTARTNCYTILTSIEQAVRQDPKLATPIGGLGLGTGWVSFGDRIRLEQSYPESTDHSVELGRMATFVFSISVYHRLYGT